MRDLERESCQIVKYLGDGLAVTVYESYVRCISILHKSSPMLQVTGCSSKTHHHQPGNMCSTLGKWASLLFLQQWQHWLHETHILKYSEVIQCKKNRIKCSWETNFFLTEYQYKRANHIQQLVFQWNMFEYYEVVGSFCAQQEGPALYMQSD